jgi:CRP-like cAMP-binding protein
MSVDPDLLRAVPLFSGMTDRALAAVAELGDESSAAAGEVLVRQGDPGDAAYLIVDGSARVEQDGREIATIGPGAIVGEIALLDGRERTATVTCTSDSRIVVVRRDAFEQLMDGFPPVRLGVLMSLTERIRRDEASALA